MVRGIIFDFDGTLVLSNHIKRQTYYEVVECLGDVSRIVDKVLASSESKNRFAIFSEIAEHAAESKALSPARSIEEWVKFLVDRYSTICESQISICPEIPGATDSLQYLTAQGYLLFINSSTPTDPLNRILRLRSFEKYFTGVYGSPVSKIENLRGIVKKYRIPIKELVVIGDGKEDQEAADAIGCHFIGVLAGGNQFKRNPSYTTQDLLKIKEVIAQIDVSLERAF